MDPQRKTRRQFSKQFKAERIALIRRSGQSVPQVCRDLDLGESVVRRWLAQAEVDDGRREGLTTVEANRRRRRRSRRLGFVVKTLCYVRRVKSWKKPVPSSHARRSV